MKATIEKSPTELHILTPYSAPFVAALKMAVPYTDRAWSKPAWIVTVKHLGVVLGLCQTHFGGADVKLIDQKAKSALDLNAPPGEIILVEYLGACKQRDDGKSSAFGFWNGGWNVIFSEEVLRGYFDGESGRDEKASKATREYQSFYQLLAIGKACSEEEIKRAYKRLARIWHPDINHEEDAQERFIAIKRAYDVLGDPQMRRKYDAGLALEASLNEPRQAREPVYQSQFYRAPLTCGKVEVTGQTRLGKFYVDSILAWWDVLNIQGKTMVSSWSKADETFKVEWVI